MNTTDILLYSPDSLFAQTETALFQLGYYHLRFYVDDKGILSKIPTSTTAQFFYSPSGGTLRDEHLNIVLYSAKFDKFKDIGKVDS